jgi:hypothetical protein
LARPTKLDIEQLQSFIDFMNRWAGITAPEASLKISENFGTRIYVSSGKGYDKPFIDQV